MSHHANTRNGGGVVTYAHDSCVVIVHPNSGKSYEEPCGVCSMPIHAGTAYITVSTNIAPRKNIGARAHAWCAQ